MPPSVLFTSGTQGGTGEAPRCSRMTRSCSVCPGNMQEGSEGVGGGREELRAACDTFRGEWDAPGHAGHASQEKGIQEDGCHVGMRLLFH